MKTAGRIMLVLTCKLHSFQSDEIFQNVLKNPWLGFFTSKALILLTKDVRDEFDFTVYPTPIPGWGHGKNVADEKQWLFRKLWPNYGVYTRQDAEGVAFIRVNLKRHYYVKAFAISGYAGGNHKPVGSFFLEGSSDGADWKMVAESQAHQWHAPGTYPFRPEQIIHAIYPGRYKQYRVIAKGWVNREMLVYNWGLFT